ncbi:MAG TPA: S-adenosylmethionine decarboxylase [Acidimicrobiales bacterium]
MGVAKLFDKTEPFPDLAPALHRQRLVVEGFSPTRITADQIKCYLRVLSVVCGMKRLNDPVTHCSARYGWAGWVHWEASGAHLYAWEDPLLFFSVDIYTCAEFDNVKVAEFTSAFFAAEEVVAKSF